MQLNKKTMFDKKLLAVFVASVSLSACVATSKKETADNTRSTIEQTLPEISDQWVVEAPIAVQEVVWMESFDDPVLTALVQEALSNNLNLQASASGVERARAMATQAGAALKPNVNLSVGGARSGSLNTSANTSNSFNAGLQVGWEADIWGRIRSGAQAAAASAEAAEADFLFAQYSLAASTIRAYILAIDAKTQTQVATESLDILKETLRIVQLQLDNGIGLSQDLALTKSDLATAEAQFESAKGAERNAIRSLELLLGRYPGAELKVRNELPSVPPAPVAGVPSELLERRPDLIAAERRVAAAFDTVQQAKTARLPSLSLSGNLGGSSQSLSDLLDPANAAWQLGSSLLAPIFDGGQRRAQVEIATADQEQALANYGQTALNTFAEVEQALDQGLVVAAQEELLNEAVQEAEKAYFIAKIRYEAGETSLTDLLSIQQRFITAKSSYVSVKRLLIENRVDLNLILGGDWEV